MTTIGPENFNGEPNRHTTIPRAVGLMLGMGVVAGFASQLDANGVLPGALRDTYYMPVLAGFGRLVISGFMGEMKKRPIAEAAFAMGGSSLFEFAQWAYHLPGYDPRDFLHYALGSLVFAAASELNTYRTNLRR